MTEESANDIQKGLTRIADFLGVISSELILIRAAQALKNEGDLDFRKRVLIGLSQFAKVAPLLGIGGLFKGFGQKPDPEEKHES